MSDSLNPEFRRRRTLNKLDSVTIQPLLNCNDKLADLQALCYHDMKSQGTNGHKSDDSFKVHLSGNSYEDIGVKRYFAPIIHGLLRISCSRKHETHGLLTLVSYADFSVGGQGATRLTAG